MTVVNTSPVIHLHLTMPGGIASLPELIGEVTVPFEVVEELACGRQKDDTWKAVRKVRGITCLTAPRVLHPLLAGQIDVGEAAVIQTAMDEHADAVILDDRKARRIAAMLGVAVTGTLGVLLQAKSAGVLSSISQAVMTLRKHGIWLDEALVRQVLSVAGE